MTETQRIRELAKLAGQPCCDICDQAQIEVVCKRSAVGEWLYCRVCYVDLFGEDALAEVDRIESFARAMARAKTPKEKQLVMLGAWWGGR